MALSSPFLAQGHRFGCRLLAASIGLLVGCLASCTTPRFDAAKMLDEWTKFMDDQYVLRISDDGRGFDPGADHPDVVERLTKTVDALRK